MGVGREDLADRIWPDNLQEVQDQLARAIGMPVLFTHASGRPLAACEDLTDFCRRYTRAVTLSRPCLGCGRGGEVPAREGPLSAAPIHHCPLGALDVSAPITCAGEEVGHLVTAQTRGPAATPSGLGRNEPPQDSGELNAFLGRLPLRSDLELGRAASCLAAAASLIGSVVSARRRNLRLAEHLREQNRWAQQHVITDPVTGVANLRRFRDSLEAETLRARRYQRDLSVALLDIEGFRKLNEEFGHAVGDATLRALAGCLCSTVRQTDLVARVGGDEFALLLPETGRAEALLALARVGNSLADLNASGELPVEVRVTTGVVERTAESDSLLEAAIRAERQARKLGSAAGH